jgi:hypothetical protein
MILMICAPIGVGVALYVRSQLREKREEDSERAKAKAQTKEVEDSIESLAAKHNAVEDWYKTIPKDRTTETLYTADLTPLLIRPDRRPILFLGEIKDVRNDADKYVLTVSSEGFGAFPKINYLLEANQQLGKHILDARRQKGERFAIIAQITDLQKGEELVHPEDGESSYSQAVFSARGQSIDIISVGQYKDDVIRRMLDALKNR